jgi:uncharacterized protein YceH (UPF0502 family)
VTRMRQMFSKAYDFDQALGDWDVSSVTMFDSMFYLTELQVNNACLKSDVYVSWAFQQRSHAFAEKYSDWAPAELPAWYVRLTGHRPGTCDARRRLSYEAPADAKVAALEAKNDALEAKNSALEEKVAELSAKFAALEAKLTAA